MKRIIPIVIIALAMGLSSCSKDEVAVPPNPIVDTTQVTLPPLDCNCGVVISVSEETGYPNNDGFRMLTTNECSGTAEFLVILNMVDRPDVDERVCLRDWNYPTNFSW